MYPFYFCAVFLFLVTVSSSIVPREQEKEAALLFYNQETKNVNSISKLSQVTYEGVNQTFIQRQRRNAQGNNFRHPMLRMKTIVNLQQYFIVCVFMLCVS